MKEYKHKIRQEICNKLGKIRTDGDLKMLNAVVDLFVGLETTLSSGEGDPAILVKDIDRYSLIRMLSSDLLDKKEVELIRYLAEDLSGERKGMAS